MQTIRPSTVTSVQDKSCLIKGGRYRLYYQGGIMGLTKDGKCRVRSPSSLLPSPPDQSSACTEYAASPAWLRTVKTTSTSSSSQFLHPTGFAWGKIKTKRPGQEEGREAWGQAAYSVQAFDWTGGKGRPKERDTVRLVNALFGKGNLRLCSQ